MRSILREGPIMKLVVSYSVGDGYTYSCQSDVPVEYESAEQLLVDIEDAATRLLAARKHQRDSHLAFEEKHGTFTGSCFGKKHDEWFAKYKAFYADNPFPDERDYMVGGLFTSHFIEDEKFYAPIIYTVDEWFAARVVS